MITVILILVRISHLNLGQLYPEVSILAYLPVRLSNVLISCGVGLYERQETKAKAKAN